MLGSAPNEYHILSVPYVPTTYIWYKILSVTLGNPNNVEAGQEYDGNASLPRVILYDVYTCSSR